MFVNGFNLPIVKMMNVSVSKSEEDPLKPNFRFTIMTILIHRMSSPGDNSNQFPQCRKLCSLFSGTA